ncbi:hypothetical protein BJY01DRAFT_247739 [Aspergillus pseudoustus]|uniref:Uncharacterized protein n=1 Tax=Aspergillus pseudoustus TaxID=1810923 RepID=A0ABR4K265_9EURO
MARSKVSTMIQTTNKTLERLDKWYHRGIKQKAGDSQRQEYMEATRPMRSLSEKNAPSLAIGDFQSNMLEKTFGVREGPRGCPILDISRNEMICIPIPLEPVLDNFERATRRSNQNETIMRSRLDIMLYLTLANEQRSAFYGHDLITPAVAQHMDEVSWAPEKHISQNVTYNNACRNLNGVMDYTLWWGIADDLETNLVVVEAKAKDAASLSRAQALVSMAMIHAARKRAGKRDCRVFGIGTDSYDFWFLAIDNNSVWTSHYIRWYTSADKREIISRIGKIIREAAALVPTSNRSSLETAASVRSKTGLIISDHEMEDVNEEE